MRILFMGTPDFAETALKALIDDGREVVGVISQPDKPVGRKKVMTAPPVKNLALLHGIPVAQPNSLKNEAILPLLNEWRPDIIVVVAYGKILPKYVLEFPKYGAINIHGSLLPRLRGAAPIQWSIINGDTETGVTSMFMAEGLDTGDMLLKKKIPILPEDTAESLFDRLAVLGGEVLLDTLDAIRSGTVSRTPQNEAEATYAPILTRDTGKIDFHQPSLQIYNLVRGLYSWPAAFTTYQGKKCKVYSVKISDKKGNAGQIISASVKEGLVIGTLDGAIEICELQFDGKKRMTAKEYFAGHEMQIGTEMGG